MSKAAVSGGVTVVAVEPGIYLPYPQVGSVLYCDCYNVTIIDDNSIPKIAECKRSGTAVAKAYLYPPSSALQCVTDLPRLFALAAEHNVTIVIDAFSPDRERLYTASPFHHASIEGRLSMQVDHTQVFAGAFHYMNSSSSEEEIDFSFPERRVTHGASILNAYNGSSFASDEARKSSACEAARPNSFLFRETEQQQPTPQTTRADIYDDLERRIKRNKTNYADLVKIESQSYNEVKIAVVEQSTTEDNSPQVSELEPQISPVKGEEVKSPGKLRRPAGLTALRKPSNPENRTMTYLNFLVNCPDKWESEGVKKVLKAYETSPCKLHFANLSAATALNKVRKLRKTFPDITCETSPHYLFFTDDTVPPNDTRYKCFPPIRNLNNNNLLWELLKVKAVDMISSNHTVVRPDLKFLAEGDFQRAATGFSSLGFNLQAVWTKLRSQSQDSATLEHYIVRLSKWLSSAPAKLLGLEHQRGSICKGKLADLVVWNPYEYNMSQISHSAFGDTSPFAGMQLAGRIERVYVRGKLAFSAGTFKAVGKRMVRVYS
mmetsp:Transcript_34722/g.61092  ORF Transcript_34722/g.61092 Transcript_34722/m.61092 type:complete len:546 (+) Transcript_34722:4421-6058(+)